MSNLTSLGICGLNIRPLYLVLVWRHWKNLHYVTGYWLSFV